VIGQNHHLSNTIQATGLIERLESTQLHFIITFGRSGSTLLQAMLNQHPNILATLEQHFFLVNYRHFHKKRNWTDADIHLFVNNIWLRKKEMAYLWKINKAVLIEQLKTLRISNKLNYKNACKLVYMNHYQFNEDTKIIIDKNPIYLAHTDKILNIFNSAKIILLLRDYRSFYASIKNYESKAFESNFAYLLSWKIGANRLIKQLNKNALDYTLVKYEDLIHQTENNLQKICAFLSLNYNDCMLSYMENDSFNAKEFGEKSAEFQMKIKRNHSNINKPIIKEKAQSWKTHLSEKEISTLEILIGSEGAYWEYHSSKKNSGFQRFWFYASNILKLTVNYVKAYAFVDLIFRLPFSVHRFIVEKGNQIIQNRNK